MYSGAENGVLASQLEDHEFKSRMRNFFFFFHSSEVLAQVEPSPSANVGRLSCGVWSCVVNSLL